MLTALVMPLLLTAACAQPTVRPVLRTEEHDLRRPARIVVGNFAAAQLDVVEYQGIFRQQPSNPNAAERRSAIARKVSEALSLELMKGLKELGMPVNRGIVASVNDDELIVEGEFIRIDEGNPLRRWAVGLGSGAAKVQTRIRVYQEPRRRKVLEFTTEADSGTMPGAAVTASAGVVTSPIVSTGLLAGNALTTGLENRSDVIQLARSSGDQAARYLSEFFARQGWIRPDQVKKARIAY